MPTPAAPIATPTALPKPVMAPVAMPQAKPIAQAKPVASAPAPAATPSISTTSMPKPQMVTPSSNQSSPASSGGPDIAGYIKAAQAQGISSDEIYQHLQQLGYVDSTGAITTTKQATPKNPGTPTTSGTVLNSDSANASRESIGQTFEQGGQNVIKDVTDMPGNARAAGGGPLADVAAEAQGAGHIAGDVGGTAGGLLGDVIAPLLPDSVKVSIGDATKYVTDKVNSIPGMTPEIAKGLADLFNTGSLLGGGEAVEAAPSAARAVGNAASDAAQAVGEKVGDVKNVVTDAAGKVVPKLQDMATPNPTPTMQTLINRVKSDPVQAKNVAENFKNYVQTARNAVKVTGAPQPSDIAGGQFKTAMTKLSKNMNTAGESMKTALEPVAQAKASGVNDIMQYLKDQTAERLGSEYTPMSDSAVRDSMKGMTPAQRYQHLNDMIDGKAGTNVEEGVFRPVNGREMTVKDGTDLKKLADLHETINNLGDNPSVQQLHDTVQRWQEDLYKSSKPGATPIDSKIRGLMKQVGGQLNAKAKETASSAEKAQGIEPGTYADAKANYARLADLNENMSRRLGSNFKNAGSLIKRIFTPQNGDLNKYIGSLEKETGVPIFDHATLAKYASQLAGDTRMNSLLDKPMETAQHVEGFLKSLMNIDLTKPVASAVNIGKGAAHFLANPEAKVMRQLGQ